MRDVVQRILVRRGYQVLTAPNGTAAVELVGQRDGPIDLLVTDVVMPQMLGNEVAEHIVAMRPEVRVLYMSGYALPVLGARGGCKGGWPWSRSRSRSRPFSPGSERCSTAPRRMTRRGRRALRGHDRYRLSFSLAGRLAARIRRTVRGMAVAIPPATRWPPRPRPTEATMRPQSVPVNVYETPGALVVVAPLPAVTTKDVTVELRPGCTAILGPAPQRGPARLSPARMGVRLLRAPDRYPCRFRPGRRSVAGEWTTRHPGPSGSTPAP